MLLNKKTELTRLECFVLSIAQWCVADLLSAELKGRNVFLTEVSMSTISIDKLKSSLKICYGQKYKAYKLKAHFTILTETSSQYYDGKQYANRPSIQAEMLFRDIGTKSSIGTSVGIWEISGVGLEILDCPYTLDDHVHYDSLRLKTGLGVEWYTMELMEREKRFLEFFKTLFYCSMGEVKNVTSFDGNIVSNV